MIITILLNIKKKNTKYYFQKREPPQHIPMLNLWHYDMKVSEHTLL
jgi:hypothetical protein